MEDVEENAVYERFFANVGRYTLFFQALEGMIDTVLVLLWGVEDVKGNNDRLKRLTNERKISAMLDAFRDSALNARGRSRADWVVHFEGTVERLHDERRRRNSLLHSQYIYDFVRIGQPIVQADRKVGQLSEWPEEKQRELVAGVTGLIYDFGYVVTQVRHDVIAAAIERKRAD